MKRTELNRMSCLPVINYFVCHYHRSCFIPQVKLVVEEKSISVYVYLLCYVSVLVRSRADIPGMETALGVVIIFCALYYVYLKSLQLQSLKGENESKVLRAYSISSKWCEQYRGVP